MYDPQHVTHCSWCKQRLNPRPQPPPPAYWRAVFSWIPRPVTSD